MNINNTFRGVCKAMYVDMTEADVKICQEFEDYIRKGMDAEEFWKWVEEWIDVDMIIEQALNWDTEYKKELLEEWRKEGKIK